MGKKERERKQAGRKARAASGNRGSWSYQHPSESDVDRIFSLVDCVPITSDVKVQLIDIGWSEAKLNECQQQGGLYCAPRDSIIFPEPAGVEMVRDGKDFLVHHHKLLFTRP